MKNKKYFNQPFQMILLLPLLFSGCASKKNTIAGEIKLMTLNPGHFHAALVQKSMYNGVSNEAFVYAPVGSDVEAHLNLIEKYNGRVQSPTTWKEIAYKGDDFLEKMLNDKKGNVLVLAGNNQEKTNYIHKAVSEGINVLADKPMAIDTNGFALLKKAFKTAATKKVLLYDIMTERFEITNIIQRELAQLKNVFGTLRKGTLEAPAIKKESVHHFFKYVSGVPLIRPAWYFDINQEGNGLVDVTTHLVDLIQWSSFPDVPLNYEQDINMLSARRWTTPINREQFKKATNLIEYPAYLNKAITGDLLQVYSNGEMNYTIKGIHAKVSVVWNFEAPTGTGDTHFSLMSGTKANLIIRQGKEQNYKPVLYIEPVTNDVAYAEVLAKQFAVIQQHFPGVELKKNKWAWEIIIPEKYNIGHEAHFAEVTKKYLNYLHNGKLPSWEVPNMLAKYFTTTQALATALQMK